MAHVFDFLEHGKREPVSIDQGHTPRRAGQTAARRKGAWIKESPALPAAILLAGLAAGVSLYAGLRCESRSVGERTIGGRRGAHGGRVRA